MTVKIPDSLPWIANGDGAGSIQNSAGGWLTNQADVNERTAYIVHAANSYPALVEALRDMTDTLAREPSFDFRAHLTRQRAFSEKTFGPGARTKGVIDHIRKELAEIEADPSDISEWIDVVILALDGAWRSGHSPEQIIAALVAKQDKNEARSWPDWRTADPNSAIEHDRTKDAPAPVRPSPPADLAEKLKTCDQDRVHRGKLLKKVRDTLYVIDTDDEGDRVYFVSSNDADMLSDLKATLEDWRWDDIMREDELPDLVENCRKANERAEAAEQALAEEREACAKVADMEAIQAIGCNPVFVAHRIAAAIRARKGGE